MDFFNKTKIKKTRKARWCDWCGEKIQKGDPSVCTAGIFEGDFFTGRYHPECDAAVERYYDENDCYGEVMPEELMTRGGITEKSKSSNEGK